MPGTGATSREPQSREEYLAPLTVKAPTAAEVTPETKPERDHVDLVRAVAPPCGG